MVGKSVFIAGLNKAEILAALYNNAKPRGLGWRHYDPNPMTVEQAQKCLKEGDDFVKALGKAIEERSLLYFDYLRGRALKVDLSGNEFDPTEYNHIYGRDAAECIIARLYLYYLLPNLWK